jgi:uncharacterized protein (DUF952 family)
MTEVVYKILTGLALAEARRIGRYTGSADDLRDGFIHLSTAHQLEDTLAKHFPGQSGLFLLAVDADKLGPDLRWEPSRGGAHFPHLYAPLPLNAVFWAAPVTLDDAGQHVLPRQVHLSPLGRGA